jgi:hypothetical protein
MKFFACLNKLILLVWIMRDMTMLLGRYGGDRTGLQTKHFALVIQWINGQQQVVWPRELLTMALQFS